MADLSEVQLQKTRRRRIAAKMGVGIALGVALGAAMGYIANGLVIGIVIGGIGVAMDLRRMRKDQ